MSDVMLLGVLRIPPELWIDNPIARQQYCSRFIEAADRIESDAKRIAELEAALADERRWNEKRKGVFARIGVALEPYREKRWSGESARNDADEVDALCAKVAELEAENSKLWTFVRAFDAWRNPGIAALPGYQKIRAARDALSKAE